MGACGISLAAKPGNSNHEGGLAIDVNDAANWNTYLAPYNFRYLGASDPVHFDYLGGGVDIKGTSVLAFQQLWNCNNPTDQIAADGVYGPNT
jgi:N-acetylmuramoyl-L-alanine amidase